MVQELIDGLLDQTKSIERAVAALDLSAIQFEGSDSLDNPEKVEEENKSAGAAARWPARSEVASASDDMRPLSGQELGYRDGTDVIT